MTSLTTLKTPPSRVSVLDHDVEVQRMPRVRQLHKIGEVGK